MEEGKPRLELKIFPANQQVSLNLLIALNSFSDVFFFFFKEAV